MFQTIKFYKLKLKIPKETIFLQYKSIIFPDKKPYRINCYIDIYNEKNKEHRQKLYNIVLLTYIYPYFEKEWIMKNNYNFNNNSIKSLKNEINKYSCDYDSLYSKIDIYPDPNGYSFFSPYNKILTRNFINEIIK